MEHTELSFDCYPLEYIAVGVSGIAFRDNKNLERFFICHYGTDTELLSILLLLLEEAEEQKAGYGSACQALGCPADPPCPEAGASSGSLHPVQDDKGVQSD